MGAGCPENSESEPQGSYKSEGVQGSAGYTLGIFRLIVSGLGVWGFGFFFGFRARVHLIFGICDCAVEGLTTSQPRLCT